MSALTDLADAFTRLPAWHLYPIFLGIALFSWLFYRGEVRAGRGGRQRLYEVILMTAVGILGFSGFSGFLAHTVFADATAASIGWAAGSPFQTEVAGANLAIGVIGALGFWRRDMWLPFILARGAFGFTAGATHIADMIERGNFAPNNVGVLPANFLVPIVLAALLWMYVREGGRLSGRPLTAPDQPAHPAA